MIQIFEILIVGIVLSADSFSAALAMGARKHKQSDVLKFAVSSGGAEAFVTFIGSVAGAKVIVKFVSIGPWISFILLSAVSIHIALDGITELRNPQKNNEKSQKFHSFTKILIVSFATSLDAFAVGVSLGVTGKPLIPYVSSIGLWAFFSTIIGMQIASKASNKLGPIFSLIGSFVLITLAFIFLFEGL